MARNCERLGFALLLGPLLFQVAGCRAPEAPDGHRPRFVFQNSFWVNLHHLLRAEARRATRGEESVLPVQDLWAEERTDWSAAVAAYRELGKRDLLFDEGMVAINVALAGAGEPETLPS